MSEIDAIREVGRQRILYVDLSSQKNWVEEVPPEELRLFLGGRGINAKLLYERVPRGVDPLGPDNVLIFGTGTLTGTSAPSSGRTSVTCKSPATGLYLKVNGGGHLGAELKYAGYDYLVVLGVASRPVYLWIDDDRVSIRDAGHLWGKTTLETDERIKGEIGDQDIETAVIGQAGERQVLFSNIMISVYSSASRGGVGAVMGSKRLKAIAVRGRGGLSVADPEIYFELAAQLRQDLAQDPSSRGLYRWGTIGGVPADQAAGVLPAYNFGRTGIEDSEKISGQYLEEAGHLTGRESCFACSTACHRFVRSVSPTQGDVKGSGPEYEAAVALGANCGIADADTLIRANQLCNRFGLDVISTGHVISWAMECYERGVLDQERCEGLELRFGNGVAQLEMIRRIALREGLLGDLLAYGTRQAAQEVGADSWKWAVQAKGLEQSSVDIRASKGYALSFAVNPRGPDHLMTEVLAELGYTEEQRQVVEKITGSREYADPSKTEKRAELVRWHEDCYAASDALGFCVFTSTSAYAINPQNMAELTKHALGFELSEDELMLAGRRIVTLERCFNVREGARRKDDVLPRRMTHEPIPVGPKKGMVTDPASLGRMLDEYYSLHGWSLETAIPERETLVKLGLAELCSDMPLE
jgi:aldehyde:ferredoxin oxidoreductase